MDKPTPFAVNKGRIFNTAVSADTNIFLEDLVPSDLVSNNQASTVFRITVCLDTLSKFNVVITNNATSVVGEFNSGAKLPANTIFTFTHEVRDQDTVNYQLGTGSTIKFLYISEVRGEAI